MEYLEKMGSWLQSCPLLDGTLQIDHTDGKPGCCGLFPTGLKELSRREDITGGAQATLRCSFVLRRVAANGQGQAEHAGWLLSLQEWIRRQSMAGNAPTFGDAPSRERVWAHSGRLERVDPNGTVLYSLQLQAEFIKNIDEKE